MRVIAGSSKGRILKSPKTRAVRPTADRVKEALFSSLTSMYGSFYGMSILDLCAGSGSLGIEALSRGAELAVFVDNNSESLLLIHENLQITQHLDSAFLMAMDVFDAVRRLSKENQQFDIILFDPPYALDIGYILSQISTEGLIKDQGVIVVEQGAKTFLPDTIGRFSCINRKAYGDSALFYYQLSNEEMQGQFICR